jgi:hypothetical protein
LTKPKRSRWQLRATSPKEFGLITMRTGSTVRAMSDEANDVRHNASCAVIRRE